MASATFGTVLNGPVMMANTCAERLVPVGNFSILLLLTRGGATAKTTEF